MLQVQRLSNCVIDRLEKMDPRFRSVRGSNRPIRPLYTCARASLGGDGELGIAAGNTYYGYRRCLYTRRASQQGHEFCELPIAIYEIKFHSR